MTFRTLQLATTLGYGLVICTSRLSCLATQPCGFKIEITWQSLTHKKKWRTVKANHRRTKDKFGILTKTIHSDLGIFILQTCDKFHSSVPNRCLAGRTQAHHYHSYFVRAHNHCALSALGNESLKLCSNDIGVFKSLLLSISEQTFTNNLHVYLTFHIKAQCAFI